MVQPNYEDKNSFLYPRDRYYGQVKPKNLVFNANLQDFAQKISSKKNSLVSLLASNREEIESGRLKLLLNVRSFFRNQILAL